MLATRHRDMAASLESSGSGAGLELATPVLERSPWQAASQLLPVSLAWLLAGTAPPLYSRPVQPPPQPQGTYHHPLAGQHSLMRVCLIYINNFVKGNGRLHRNLI